MGNLSRLGAAVAAATLVGISDNPANAYMDSNGIISSSTSEPNIPLDSATFACREAAERLELKLALTRAELQKSNQALQTLREESSEQVAKCVMQLDTMEQTCEDATQEDGCPAGYTSTNNNTADSEFVPYTGGNTF